MNTWFFSRRFEPRLLTSGPFEIKQSRSVSLNIQLNHVNQVGNSNAELHGAQGRNIGNRIVTSFGSRKTIFFCLIKGIY